MDLRSICVREEKEDRLTKKKWKWKMTCIIAEREGEEVGVHDTFFAGKTFFKKAHEQTPRPATTNVSVRTYPVDSGYAR
jgi:hypothetical protein